MSSKASTSEKKVVKTVIRPSDKQQSASPVRMTYDTANASYCGQFSVQGTHQEVFINFAASLIPGANDEMILPVHSRIAMNYLTAKRLSAVLNDTVAKYEQEYGKLESSGSSKNSSKEKNTKANFPSLEL